MYLQVLGFNNNQKLMQYSWNYMNDSLRTDVFVRYQPETVACACIYLTARKLKLPLPKNPPWFTIFGATEAEIRDICVRILKLYIRPKVIEIYNKEFVLIYLKIVHFSPTSRNLKEKLKNFVKNIMMLELKPVVILVVIQHQIMILLVLHKKLLELIMLGEDL